MAEKITALALEPAELSDGTKAYFAKCVEKLGLIPNVLLAYAFDEKKLRAFTDMYNDLMLGESGLSKLEREMIAVAVSSVNHCYYCLTAHGAAVRQLSGDPALGEMMVMNYRAARDIAEDSDSEASSSGLPSTRYESCSCCAIGGSENSESSGAASRPRTRAPATMPSAGRRTARMSTPGSATGPPANTTRPVSIASC